MSCIKAVKFQFEPNERISELLTKFKELTNFCLQKGLENKISSRFKLIKTVYEESKIFGLHTHYVLNACEVACAILKNYRKKSRKNKNVRIPQIRKLFLKLDNQTYKIKNSYLRIPFKPREFVYLKLKYGDYQKRFLEDKTLKLGSITVTMHDIVVSFKKEPSVVEPDGVMAFDTNERSLDGLIFKDNKLKPIKWDLSEVYRLHNVYFKKRRNIQIKLAHSKYKKRLLEKYSDIERKRVEQEIHKIGKQVSEYASQNNLKIIFEDLRNIGNSVNKKVKKINKYNNKEQNFSVHSKRLKRRLNSWNFRKLQQNIDYKVSWLGLQVQYVNPKNTSKACAICGQLNEIGSNKQFVCVECGFQIDRQLNACLNLIKTQDGARWFSADNFADDFMYLKSEGIK